MKLKPTITTGIGVLFLFTLTGCKPGIYYSPKHNPPQQGQTEKPHGKTSQTQQAPKFKPEVGKPLINFSEPGR